MTSTEQLLITVCCFVLVSEIATITLTWLFSMDVNDRINDLNQRLSKVDGSIEPAVLCRPKVEKRTDYQCGQGYQPTDMGAGVVGKPPEVE